MEKVNGSHIQHFLKEGDILLFKHKGLFGWFVSQYSGSDYSHVGIVHILDGQYYCIEFREFIGCRMIDLKQYIQENCDRIDVFRPASYIYFNNDVIRFDAEIAGKITAHAKQYIGHKYSWSTIFFLLQQYVPFSRLIFRQSYIDTIDPKNFVCSTLVAYLYREYYTDLVSYLGDSYTKPGDIARSPILKLKYTLVCGK
jgi:hypothetical protein